MQGNVKKRDGWEERKKRKEVQLARWLKKHGRGCGSKQWGGTRMEQQQTLKRARTKEALGSEARKEHAEVNKNEDSSRDFGDEEARKEEQKRSEEDEKRIGRKNGMDPNSDISWPSTLREEEDTEVDEEEADDSIRFSFGR